MTTIANHPSVGATEDSVSVLVELQKTTRNCAVYEPPEGSGFFGKWYIPLSAIEGAAPQALVATFTLPEGGE